MPFYVSKEKAPTAQHLELLAQHELLTAERDALVLERDNLIIDDTSDNATIAALSTQINTLNAAVETKDTEISNLQEQIIPDTNDIDHITFHCNRNGAGKDFPVASLDVVDAQCTTMRYLRFDYTKAVNVPQKFFEMNTVTFFYLYYLDFTGATGFPEPVVDNNNMRYLYIDYSYGQATSLNDSVINSFPESWSKLKKLERIYLRRNELSSEKQIALINSLEQRVIAGMGSGYNSTHRLYFTLTGTGQNLPIDRTSLLANGWIVVNSTTIKKTIAGDIWYVYHY